MIKLLLITLLICGTLVNAARKTSSKPITTKGKEPSVKKEELSDNEAQSSDDEDDDTNDDDNDDEDDEDEKKNRKDTSSTAKSKNSKSKSKNSSKPALTCVLFSDIGCGVECIMIGAMYNIKTEGICSVENTCDCTAIEKSSLDTLWKRKFNSNAILREIKKKTKLAKQVYEKLKQPFRTEKQSKQDLKSILTPEQFKRLRTTDLSLASKLTKSNGKLDYESIEARVLGVLRWALPSPNSRLSGYQYDSKLKSALNKTEDGEKIHHIINEVRRSKNKDLVNIVDDYVQKNNFKEKSVKSNNNKSSKDKGTMTAQTLEEFVSFTIIDEFINYIKYRKWLDRTTPIIPFNPPYYLHYVPLTIPPPPPPVVYVPPISAVPPMPPMPYMPPMFNIGSY